MKGGLSLAMERYLRAVYRMSRQGGMVTQAALARSMGRSKPSVSRAVELLRREGLLEPTGRGLKLTPDGWELERRIAGVQEQMQALLTGMGLPEIVAAAGAEQIARCMEAPLPEKS